jgi:hypothetical protein
MCIFISEERKLTTHYQPSEDPMPYTFTYQIGQSHYRMHLEQDAQTKRFYLAQTKEGTDPYTTRLIFAFDGFVNHYEALRYLRQYAQRKGYTMEIQA